jgi:hypothetical protein
VGAESTACTRDEVDGNTVGVRPVALIGTLVKSYAVGARCGTGPTRFFIRIEVEAPDEIAGMIVETAKSVGGRVMDGACM